MSKLKKSLLATFVFALLAFSGSYAFANSGTETIIDDQLTITTENLVSPYTMKSISGTSGQANFNVEFSAAANITRNDSTGQYSMSDISVSRPFVRSHTDEVSGIASTPVSSCIDSGRNARISTTVTLTNSTGHIWTQTVAIYLNCNPQTGDLSMTEY